MNTGPSRNPLKCSTSLSRPISLAIKDLEEQLGVTLFDRENKRFQLSQEGKYMYEVTKDILTQINALEVQMKDLGKHRNQLCISVPILTGMFMLNLFMNDFRKEHPDIYYIIRQYNSPKAFKSLDDGSCDVAIIVDEGSFRGIWKKGLFSVRNSCSVSILTIPWQRKRRLISWT